jgi:XTP/dITP diphosphohydrolase
LELFGVRRFELGQSAIPPKTSRTQKLFVVPGRILWNGRMTTLVLATRNAHKVQEIRSTLSDAFEYLTLNDFPGAPAVVEDAPSFAGNAAKKAMALARWLLEIQNPKSKIQNPKLFALADDSGLEVDALNGAPGVHSARFAALDESTDRLLDSSAGNSPDVANNARLLRLLENVPPNKRTARFRCVLALAEINPQSAIGNPQLFSGVCEGRISFAPSGGGGFGYDPIFVPSGYEQSFAELGEAVKNKFSHRARALEQLKQWIISP